MWNAGGRPQAMVLDPRGSERDEAQGRRKEDRLRPQGTPARLWQRHEGWRAFVSQSHSAESGHQGELDPLLEFNAELSAVESPVKPLDPPPAAAAAQTESAEPLRQRLEQAERSLDRARIEITSLKSDLATLVTAVDDIKKRLTRRPETVFAPATVPVPHRALGRVTAIVILVLTLGVAIWGLACRCSDRDSRAAADRNRLVGGAASSRADGRRSEHRSRTRRREAASPGTGAA